MTPERPQAGKPIERGPPLTSTRNPRVRAALELRQRSARREQGRFLIDGSRELLRALEAGVALEGVFVYEPACTRPEGQAALARLSASGVARWDVGQAVAQKLAFGERAEGLVAVARSGDLSLARLALSPRPLVVVLDGAEKPGNLGAVLRTADAAGADAVIASGEGVDFYNPNVIRGSLGTVFSVPVAAASAEQTRAWLREQKLQIVTARVEAQQTLWQADLRGPVALVLGSEARGLGDDWHGPDVLSVRLPQHGAADSLNLSATAAVLLYEALRQRG